MEEERKELREAVEKLRLNREKVPLELLKTKYKVGYEKQVELIKAAAQKGLLPIAAKPPWYLKEARINSIHMERLTKLFAETYQEGDYAKRIGRALFHNFSVDEAEAIAEEINQAYLEKLEAVEFFHEGTGLFITETNGIRDGTTPKVYNEFINKFWEEGKGWRDPEPGEAEEKHGFWYNSFCRLLNQGIKQREARQ